MSSVVYVVKKTKQPRGGYLSPRLFKIEQINEEINRENENVHPSLVGLAVDYLFRLQQDNNPTQAFSISIKGAKIYDSILFYLFYQTKRNGTNITNQEEYLTKMVLSMKNDLSDSDILKAIEASTYDVIFRAGIGFYQPFKNLIKKNGPVNQIVIQNIRTMVKRMIDFFQGNESLVEYGLSFPGGFKKRILAGDCDFLSKDTL